MKVILKTCRVSLLQSQTQLLRPLMIHRRPMMNDLVISLHLILLLRMSWTNSLRMSPPWSPTLFLMLLLVMTWLILRSNPMPLDVHWLTNLQLCIAISLIDHSMLLRCISEYVMTSTQVIRLLIRNWRAFIRRLMMGGVELISIENRLSFSQ